MLARLDIHFFAERRLTDLESIDEDLGPGRRPSDRHDSDLGPRLLQPLAHVLHLLGRDVLGLAQEEGQMERRVPILAQLELDLAQAPSDLPVRSLPPGREVSVVGLCH